MEEKSFTDIPICQTSNIGIFNDEDAVFYQQAIAGAEKRRQGGYDINGKAEEGGEYDENNPPAGKTCGGFLKGNVGIIWKDDVSPPPPTLPVSSTTDGPGYCQYCGYSLYHYAEQDCLAANSPTPKHPKWEGSPPPSFAEVNS
jgi:hypothetical protein